METSIIELKESESIKGSNPQNGSYSINLKKSLILNDGDELVIKNAFIDTIASSGGLIVLEDDFTVSIDFCRGFTYNTGITGNNGAAVNTIKELNNNSYKVRASADVDERHKTREDERSAGTVKGDGLTYFQIDDTTIDNSGQHFKRVSSLSFFSDYSDNTGDDYGGVLLTGYYQNASGNRGELKVQLKNSTGKGVSDKETTQQLIGETFVYDNRFKIDPDVGGYEAAPGIIITNSPSDLLKNHHVNPNGFQFGGEVVPSGDVFSLIKESISFTIPKGAYDPNQLARIITDNMIKIDPTFPTFDADFEFPKPFTSPIYNYPSDIPNPGGGTKNYQFLCQTSEVVLELEFGNFTRPMCGCSEFSFVFDQDTQTFKFVSLHSPFYINSGTAGAPVYNIGTLYTADQSTISGGANSFRTPFIDSKQGEIIILGLSAKDSVGKLVDFWFEKLGIDPKIIINPDNHQTFDFGGGIEALVPQLNYTVGVNATDVLRGADSILPKGILVPQVGSFLTTQPQINLMTTAIFGEKTLGQLTDVNGYFMIEISGYNNDSRVISTNNIDVGISSIISRYYASTAYTNGYISDSIVYTHRGEAITLSNFNVRILDPSKLPSKDIGSDSAIFLMIERGQPEEPIEEKK